MLREYTGLSWEDFARMIGVQPSTAASIVRRNSRLDVSVCAACRRLAREFHLPKLTDWFDKELLRLVRTQRNRRDSGIGSENRKYYDEIR